MGVGGGWAGWGQRRRCVQPLACACVSRRFNRGTGVCAAGFDHQPRERTQASRRGGAGTPVPPTLAPSPAPPPWSPLPASVPRPPPDTRVPARAYPVQYAVCYGSVASPAAHGRLAQPHPPPTHQAPASSLISLRRPRVVALGLPTARGAPGSGRGNCGSTAARDAGTSGRCGRR